MLTPIRRFSVPLAASLGAALLLTTACPAPREEAAPAPAAQAPPVGCQADGGKLQLGCPSFPNTSPKVQPEWDYFAWNSFVAANWPAVVPQDNHEQRGFPDLEKNFATAGHDTLLVWETFKEKREVFVQGSSANPGPWNQKPTYGPVDPSIPLCKDNQGGDASPRRYFGQGQKIVFDSLDETVEVASEALEPGAALCAGYVEDPKCDTPQAAPCCTVHRKAVGPRVWKGSPTKHPRQPVLYEVKVNYDFYNYVTADSRQYYLDATAATAAQAGKIVLPYRTSAQQPPLQANGKPAPPAAQSNSVTSYDAQACVDAYYSQLTPSSNLTPCPIGSVHLKAAWIKLEDEDPAKYHTADAAFFKTQKDGTTCMSHGKFGLVGLHIIQRIHQGSTSDAQSFPLGGTYVFATWEHVDNDRAGFTYANDYVPGNNGLEPPPDQGFYPHPSAALPVRRKFPILDGTRRVNEAVHAAIRSVDPRSVWLKYHLVGVQFQAVNVNAEPAEEPPFPVGPNDPTGIGQPLYLANLVIETNDGLQHFQGQPPQLAPIQNFQSLIPANGTTGFRRQDPNLAFFGAGYTMGGCMGCHGVAEVKGYSFSFVLLGGQRGAGADTQHSFEIPPPPVRSPGGGSRR
jgi:hypothetical protein